MYVIIFLHLIYLSCYYILRCSKHLVWECEVINTVKVNIILKSGHTVELECEQFNTQVNKLDGRLVGYSADNVDKSKGYPAYININDISAVYIHDIGEITQQANTERKD